MLAKINLKNSYRVVPVHPCSGQTSPGNSLEREIVDRALPFDLRIVGAVGSSDRAIGSSMQPWDSGSSCKQVHCNKEDAACHVVSGASIIGTENTLHYSNHIMKLHPRHQEL